MLAQQVADITVATIDHRLRPESAAEAARVADICGSLGVPHEIIGVTVADRNIQAGARKARYAALAAWAQRTGCLAVATGHHADDQAETVLMRLNRGSGLAGLSGIRRKRLLDDGATWLVRPLLDWRRAELEEICAASPFQPVHDPSNRNPDFDRVAMRRHLAQTPWLDPAAIARSARLLAEASDHMRALAEDAFAGDRVVQDGQTIRYRPQGQRFADIEVVALILNALGGNAPRSDIARMVDRLRAGTNANLAGVLARVEQQGWAFAPEPPRSA